MLQSTECLGQEPARADPFDLQLPRGATGSSREQATPPSTAPVTRLIDTNSLLQVTPYHGDKASFLGWLEMVRLDCSASNQQTTS